MQQARVFIIASNPLSRAGLARFIEQAGFVLVGEASALAASDLSRATDAAPEIVLIALDAAALEASLPGLRTLKIGLPDSKLVVLAGISAPPLTELVEIGTSACLSQDVSPDALIQTIRLVLLGEQVFSTRLTPLMAQRPAPEVADTRPAGLDCTDAAILSFLVQGHSNKEIARHLALAESTIKGRLRAVQLKIKAGNRTQAAIWAVNNGFTNPQAIRLKDTKGKFAYLNGSETTALGSFRDRLHHPVQAPGYTGPERRRHTGPERRRAADAVAGQVPAFH